MMMHVIVLDKMLAFSPITALQLDDARDIKFYT